MATKGYGFSVEDINGSCPADLKPYGKAHEAEMQEQDLLNYIAIGQYYRSAISEIVDPIHAALAGKKSQGAKFADKPFLSKVAEGSKPLTQDEALQQFIVQRRIDKINFDLYKKRKGT